MSKDKAKKTHGKHGKKAGNGAEAKVSNKVYEAELYRLQTELVKMQEWTRTTGSTDRHPLRGTRRRR